MTAEQYWNGDPYLFCAYRKAYKMRCEEKSREMWLQGLYFYDAVGAAIGNAFTKQRMTYMEEPIRIFGKSEEELEKEAIAERQRLVAMLTERKKAWDEKHKNDGKGS